MLSSNNRDSNSRNHSVFAIRENLPKKTCTNYLLSTLLVHGSEIHSWVVILSVKDVTVMFFETICLGGFNDTLCLQTLEGRHLYELCQCVKLLSGIFIVVTLSGKSNTNSGWRVLDSGRPYMLVQSSVDSNILSSHGLLCEFADFLDRPRCSALVLLLVNKLGKLNGVIPGDKVGLGSR